MTTRLVSKTLDSNTFIYDDSKTVLIFDAGASLDELKKNLKRAPDAIFITHGHYDHIFYLDDYARAFSCPIYAHERAVSKFYSPAENYGEDLVLKTARDRFSQISEESEILINGTNVLPIFTPGHTDCSVSFLLNGELFAGDFLFKTSVGRYDLLTSNKEELKASIKKILGYDFSVVHSGHGEDSSREEQKRNLAVWTRFLNR